MLTFTRMDAEWPPLRKPTAYRVWQTVLRPIAAQMRASSAELGEQVLSRVRVEVPELFPDYQIVAEAFASTEESVRQLAQIIEVAADPTRFELPPSTQAIFRSAVWRNLQVAGHLRFYRLAQDEVWQWMFTRITAASPSADEQAIALHLATGWLFAFIDQAMTRANQAYEVERDTWMRGAAASRAAAIEDIVANRERDGHSASQRLRYDVNRHHVGMIVWVEHSLEEGDVLSVLTASVAEIARGSAAEATISHPSGSLAVAAWLSGPCVFATNCMDFLENGVAALPLRKEVRIAVGEPGHHLKGFRRTHIEAGHSRRVASLLAPGIPQVTRYRDIAVAALCTSDSYHAETFVTDVLGPLAESDEVMSRLAMTLAVYLRENLSRTKTATRMHVHPNTVSYRVRQAEELLGRDVNDDTLDLRVALTMLPMLGRLQHEGLADD